jgi:exodeoxyribonuclease VII large subunit
MKTPTAVAAFLIGQMDEQAECLNGFEQTICTKTLKILSDSQVELNRVASRLPSTVSYIIEHKRRRLFALTGDLSGVRLFIEKKQSSLTETGQNLKNRLTALFVDKNRELELHEQFLKMASPEYILKKGYTLTLKEGKPVKYASEVSAGDEISIRFVDGERGAIAK